MKWTVQVADNQEKIASCFIVYKELRPHLLNAQIFIEQVQRQQQEGFKLVFIKSSSGVVACAGYRVLETFSWGKIIYIDDLITQAESRSKGHGKALLDYIKEQANLLNCKEIHLDSGYQRHDAHRFYLYHGFRLVCHHFSQVAQTEEIN